MNSLHPFVATGYRVRFAHFNENKNLCHDKRP